MDCNIQRKTARPLFRLNPWFDEFFKESFFGDANRGVTLRPALDVRETEQAMHVAVELPGVPKDQVEITLEDGVLTISGEKKSRHDDESHGVHIMERSYGAFTRTLKLPQTIDSEKAEANFTDGVLTITLPKVEAAKPKRLAIS